MPQNAPSQTDTADLTRNIRAALRPKKLEGVLEAAGATEIEGEAAEVLGETSAAQVAELVARARFEAPQGAHAPNSETKKAAKAALRPGKLEDLFEETGIDAQKGQQTAIREMARIAQEATRFAEAEERAVCHNCSAVGAARAASQHGAPQEPR